MIPSRNKSTRTRSSTNATSEQGARTAWRVLKDWIAAQLAVIEAQMVTLDQVMLPYLHAEGERTVYELFVEREKKALDAAPC